MKRQLNTGLSPAAIDSEAESNAAIEIIVSRLEELYGVANWQPHNGPVEELIGCILSQHTSDINSGRAFRDLRAKYGEWEDVRTADVEELALTIRRGGLANSKSPRIQAVLNRLKDDFGSISLDRLYTMTDTEGREYLMSLPGVGPKTAAIVLCFALGRNVMPVDTHIFRVSWRIGLIEKRIGEAKAHDVLQELVPDDLTYRYHVALITHGRKVCKAPTPRCPECPLTDICRWYFHEYRSAQNS